MKKRYLNRISTTIMVIVFLSMLYLKPGGVINTGKISSDPTGLKPVQEQNPPTPPSSIGTTQSVDYNTWYLGESVKTEITFNKAFFDYNTLHSDWDYFSTKQKIWSWQYMYADDGFVAGFEQYFSGTDNIQIAEHTHKCKIYAGGSGTLYYNEIYADVDTPQGNYDTIKKTGSVYFPTSKLDSEGYLTLELNSFVSLYEENLYIRFYWYDSNGRHQIFNQPNTVSGASEITEHGIWFDQIYFLRDTITNNIRSDYQYASATTITHKLEVPSVQHAKEIDIYYPEFWTYSSINPSASVSDTNYILTINSPTELTYEVLFLSNSSNFLTIKDVSSTYLKDVGFENGRWQDDWNFVDGQLSTDISLSTNIASSGYYSLRMNKDSTSDNIIFRLYNHAYYNTYVSFDIYYSSRTSGDYLQFVYKQDGSWVYNNLEFETNRWYKCFFYLEDVENVEFYPENANDVFDVYIDNFRIFKTSTEIETIEPSKYEFSSTLRVWDGYQNPILPYSDVHFELLERSSQAVEDSHVSKTNQDGVATWILEKGLEQKEYELRTFSTDSFFGCEETKTDVTEDSSKWMLYNHDSGTITQEDSTVVFEAKDTSGANWEIRFTPNFDLTFADYLYYRWYSNDSNLVLNYVYLYYSTGNGLLNTTNQNVQTAYHSFIERISDYETLGSPDITNLDATIFRFQTNEQYKVVISDFRFINAQKYYFTPFQVSETDYAETELNDCWDFSEGDKDGWSPYSWVSNVVENGYWEKTSTTAWSKYYIQNIDAFDESYYTTIVFRIWSNVSQTLKFAQKTGGLWGTTRRETNHPITANIWTVFTASINQEYDIDCFILNTDGNATPKKVKLDYVRLVHVDEPELIETDTNFYLSSSENMYNYAVYSDSSYLGTLSDLDVILKNNTVGNHNLTYVLYSASEKKAYLEETYQYAYTVEAAAFTVSLQSFYLSDLYVNTYVTSNYDGTYVVYEDGSPIDSGTLHKEGTTIITNRDVTPGASINYTIAFTSGSETVTFQTYYNNPSSDFFVTSYSVDIDSTITVTWDTSKDSIDSLTVIEDGVTKVSSDTASPTSWSKSTVAGEHYVTLIFSATEYNDIIYSFVYTVAKEESFSISVESFYLSDTYVNTYVTSNYDYDYYIYEDNEEKWSGSGNKEGTAISSIRNTTEGVTIDYAIKFVNGSSIIWFNTSYSNALSTFYVETYSIDIGETDIEITWDTSKDSIDSLTIIEDGILKVNTDPTSPTSWVKSSEAGEHYVTLIFSATEYNDILYSFVYTVTAPEALVVSVENFYVTDKYINLYCTANKNYNYTAYTNGTERGSGNGFKEGTFIIIPKNTTAGVFNLTVIFANGTDSVVFMTWYSNLLPPEPFQATIANFDGPTFYNITIIPNQQLFYVNVWHDFVKVIDAAVNQTFISIEKSSVVGWHYIDLEIIHTRNFDDNGAIVEPYNETYSFSYAYRTSCFFYTALRFITPSRGVTIEEIEVDDVLTYLDNVLIEPAYPPFFENSTYEGNFSVIWENRILIKNSSPLHTLKVTDLFGKEILTRTIDLSLSRYQALELPLIKLSFVNLDTQKTRKVLFYPEEQTKYLATDPPLAPGEVATFWVVNETYTYHVYYASYYVKGGKIYTEWTVDNEAIGLPYVVEGSIIIPLHPTVTGGGDEGTTGLVWWQYLLIFMSLGIIIGFWVLGTTLKNKKGVSGGLVGLAVSGSNVVSKKIISGSRKAGEKMVKKKVIKKKGGKNK